MNEIQELNHTTLIEMWSTKVNSLKAEIASLTLPSAGYKDHLRSDLRVYGMCLARTRENFDRLRGRSNDKRQAAFDEYMEAMRHRSEVFDEGKDGVVGFPNGQLPSPWDARLEEADKAVDAALLRWCAE